VVPADRCCAKWRGGSRPINAKLYSRFPVREMIRRGWVRFSENLDVLEQQFYEFFCINSIEDELGITHYAKKTDTHSEATPLQIAWLYRVRALAAQQRIPKYSREKLLLAVEKLKAMILAPEEVRHVSRTLSEAGVRLVFVEALPGSKLDGACLWLDEDKPVIGMTLRFDRIDNFWFVLRHEIEHVLQEDGKNGEPVIDIEVGEEPEDISQSEMNANIAGANFCVPADQLENFIARVSPYFSEQKVLLFAQRINVHPGLVVGQLQRRLKRHDFLRKHQVKVRALILPYADVDGWGSFSE